MTLGRGMDPQSVTTMTVSIARTHRLGRVTVGAWPALVGVLRCDGTLRP